MGVADDGVFIFIGLFSLFYRHESFSEKVVDLLFGIVTASLRGVLMRLEHIII